MKQENIQQVGEKGKISTKKWVEDNFQENQEGRTTGGRNGENQVEAIGEGNNVQNVQEEQREPGAKSQ